MASSQSSGLLDNDVIVLSASIGDADQKRTEVFEKRYEGQRAEQRKAAQASLRVLPNSHREGQLGKVRV